jgi:hypothetical protein
MYTSVKEVLPKKILEKHCFQRQNCLSPFFSFSNCNFIFWGGGAFCHKIYFFEITIFFVPKGTVSPDQICLKVCD